MHARLVALLSGDLELRARQQRPLVGTVGHRARGDDLIGVALRDESAGAIAQHAVARGCDGRDDVGNAECELHRVTGPHDYESCALAGLLGAGFANKERGRIRHRVRDVHANVARCAGGRVARRVTGRASRCLRRCLRNITHTHQRNRACIAPCAATRSRCTVRALHTHQFTCAPSIAVAIQKRCPHEAHRPRAMPCAWDGECAPFHVTSPLRWVPARRAPPRARTLEPAHSAPRDTRGTRRCWPRAPTCRCASLAYPVPTVPNTKVESTASNVPSAGCCSRMLMGPRTSGTAGSSVVKAGLISAVGSGSGVLTGTLATARPESSRVSRATDDGNAGGRAVRAGRNALGGVWDMHEARQRPSICRASGDGRSTNPAILGFNALHALTRPPSAGIIPVRSARPEPVAFCAVGLRKRCDSSSGIPTVTSFALHPTPVPPDAEPRVVVRLYGATDVGHTREHNEDTFLVADLETGTVIAFDKGRKRGPRDRTACSLPWPTAWAAPRRAAGQRNGGAGGLRGVAGALAHREHTHARGLCHGDPDAAKPPTPAFTRSRRKIRSIEAWARPHRRGAVRGHGVHRAGGRQPRISLS